MSFLFFFFFFFFFFSFASDTLQIDVNACVKAKEVTGISSNMAKDWENLEESTAFFVEF